MAEGVTNRISFEEAADLLDSARACVSWVDDGRPRIEPVLVRYDAPRFGVRLDCAPPGVGDEVVLVIDEGVLFFDLRAIYVRGSVTEVGADGWVEIEPGRVTCWDYGRLRQVDDGTD